MACLSGLLCQTSISQDKDEGLEPIPPIERRVPPAGIEIPEKKRKEWLAGLETFAAEAKALGSREERLPDAEVFAKALRLAIENGEFFKEKDLSLGDKTLDVALERLEDLKSGKAPWTEQRNLVVRGYRSAIDGSVQPYGLFIPEKADLKKPAPLLVWMHGRGDTQTDIHFINRDPSKNAALGGYFESDEILTLHAFGRQCIGWKHSGEIDVFEAIEDVKKHYSIDPDRIVLAGFSMGGAGAWHVGAHYTEEFCAVHAGAGFAETARYQNLTPEQYPVWYEQKLWGVYDVPGYVENLFNVPVIAYSGSEDKQKQAALVMEEAYQAHGKTLPHLIGPGMGHKYHPEVVKEVQAFLEQAIKDGRERFPETVTLQTQTLRYHDYAWVEMEGLGEHWKNATVEAWRNGPQNAVVKTANVTALRLLPNEEGMTAYPAGYEVTVDDQTLRLPAASPQISLLQKSGKWAVGEPGDGLRKKPGLQGPIDDAFMAPFLVVSPDKQSENPLVERWVEFELEHFKTRWRELFRGDLPVKEDKDLTNEDIANYNLIVFGDPASSRTLGKVLDKLPLAWNAKEVRVGKESFDAENHLPVMIYPNPYNPNRYVVINSGQTFREAHDRTNSLQNPKLPDWAILDLRQLPNDEGAGKVVAAGFFDEAWQVKTASKAKP